MATTLIRLQDDTLVEVDVSPSQSEQISGGLVDRLDQTLDIIKPTLLKVCRPLAETWTELNREVHLEQAEVELALSFNLEGNLYLAKTTAGANITIKLILKPAGSATDSQ